MARRIRDPWTDPFADADTDVTDEFRVEAEDTDSGFTDLESGMFGSSQTEWIDNEVTDAGRTAMRIPDAEQQTMLYGRSFDAMRESARETVLRRTGRDLGPSPVVWVGVFGTMLAAVLTALALMLLMAWFVMRAALPAPEIPDLPSVPLPTPVPVAAPVAAPSPVPEPVRFPASFAFNDWTPQNVDHSEVVKLVALLKRCPGIVVVTGHADGVGGEGVNERFALARAAGARDLLADAGLPKSRMVLASAIGSEEGESGRRVDVVCP